jgi:L-seryl-tRNA(Ser) seleniumtransferase
MDIYDRLKVKKLLNARGTLTTLGGSTMPPEVLEAMQEASRAYVNIDELLRKAGERIAELIGVDGAFITSGAAAALAVSAAACMAGTNPANIRRLPDSAGMRNEIIMLKCHRFGFDQAVRMAGARIVEAGLPERTLPEELEAALSEHTAAFLYLAEAETAGGSLPLPQITGLMNQRDIPVIVDAAAELPPVGNFKHYLAQGAALVIFSGGKDIQGPQSAGLILGRRDLIAACACNSCPNFSVGRPMKVDKESICGLVKAVELYLNQDFEREMRGWEQTVEVFIKQLSGVAGVKVRRGFPSPPGIQPVGIPRAYVELDRSRTGVSSEQVRKELQEGDPGIEADLHGDCLVLNPQLLTMKEAKAVARRLVAILQPGIVKRRSR